MSADKLFNFLVEDRRKRPELTLPFAITYHHLDSWVPVLGRDTFVFWLQLFTFANRKDYEPEANIIDYSYKMLTDKTGVSKYKITVMLRKLYEYGLLEIVEVDNRFGSKKQLYKVLTVPVYADTVYCQLKKCRSWEDRESFGQKRNETLKEKKGKSRSENQTGSIFRSQSENQTGCQFKNQTGSQSENQTIYNNNNLINKNIIQQQQHSNLNDISNYNKGKDYEKVKKDDVVVEPRSNLKCQNEEQEADTNRIELKMFIIKEGQKMGIPIDDYVADQIIEAGNANKTKIMQAIKAALQWAEGKEVRNWCGVLVRAVVDGRKPAPEGNRKREQSRTKDKYKDLYMNWGG